jgi:hypothetical protein
VESLDIFLIMILLEIELEFRQSVYNLVKHIEQERLVIALCWGLILGSGMKHGLEFNLKTCYRL